jgi:hypothetical protein
LLTDEAGVVTTHYMDITATVTSLPKYGRLYADARSLGSGNAWDLISVGRARATERSWRSSDGRHAQLHSAPRFDAELLERTFTGNRPLGQCYGLDTSTYNGVASGVEGYRHCKENYGVGNSAVAYRRRNSGDDAQKKRLRRHKVVYYHPLKDYEGVDAFDYTVRLGSYESKIATVGVHVRKCRIFEFNKRTLPELATSPLCACQSNTTWAFGHTSRCPIGIKMVCTDIRVATSFTPLCDACSGGHNMDTTNCRVMVDRAATTVLQLGLCGTVALPDCRSESISKDAPESYVWWPHRNFLTPDADAISPLGSRAADPGGGFGVAAPRLLE